jgi:3-hydroxy-9,10-secoandrosta-1,3,5(10)-triene-9,17-dione monooxygenase
MAGHADNALAEQLLAGCAAMVPRLRARAEEGEVLRRLPDATLADVVDAGLWPMLVPTSLGGHGLGVDTLATATRTLGQGCPASAWTISFLVMHSWLLAKFPAEARAELFTAQRPYALAPAPLAPTGTLHRCRGGFRVSGRWEWATGVNHADFVMVHAVQTDGEPASWFVVVPIEDVVVEDVWFTSGMRATGSNTVRLDDQFVPEHRGVAALTMMGAPGGDVLDGDGMGRIPIRSVLGLIAAAPALGAAEAAVELFRDRIGERVLAFTMGERQRDQPVTHARLGAVVSDLAAARTRWDDAIAQLVSLTGTGEIDVQARTALRLTAAATVRAARQVIGDVALASGGSAYMTSSPLQRLQRDVEVLKGHVLFDWDRTTELAGRIALGMPLRPTDMV